MRSTMTPLEAAVWAALVDENDCLRQLNVAVLNRRDTGAGRYVTLDLRSPVEERTALSMGSKFIKMEGVRNGMTAVLWLVPGRTAVVEIVVIGEAQWDGVEREFCIE